MKICLFDPSLADNKGAPSSNLGDLFIKEAIEREIHDIFKDCEIINISTHTFPTNELIRLSNKSSFIFVGGTNLLSSNLNEYRQWRISTRQIIFLSKVILFGVGWHSYQKNPNIFSRFLLKFLLSNKITHSVRDSYTKEKLKTAGINNVINTGCPTMWPFKNYNNNFFPTRKSKNALVMLTDYAKDPNLDYKLVQIVIQNYEKVFFWAQGNCDLSYFSQLVNDTNKIVVLGNTLQELNDFITEDFDYIGTRLHGGIKCLLSRKRSIILEVDNRATEISKDTNLPTLNRGDFSGLINWINNPLPIKIKVDTNAINSWKMQFSKINSDDIPIKV